jgi:hypothetical protein
VVNRIFNQQKLTYDTAEIITTNLKKDQMKRLLLILVFKTFILTCTYAQIVNIPDANFKAALVGNTLINTNSDTEIQTSEAVAYTGLINVATVGISDMTGIEAFTSITGLDCEGNTINALNLSFNTKLTSLNCLENNISALNLSSNTSLTIIYCNQNSLTALNLSALANLSVLNCSLNYLTSLNVKNGNNTNITSFNATVNSLSCIEVDNVAYSTANWSSSIDAGATFNTSCTVGIQSRPLQTQFSIFPNPVNDIVNIEIESDGNTSQLKIINLLGEIIYCETIGINQKKTQIPVTKFAKGIYTILLDSKKTKSFGKLIID